MKIKNYQIKNFSIIFAFAISLLAISCSSESEKEETIDPDYIDSEYLLQSDLNSNKKNDLDSLLIELSDFKKNFNPNKLEFNKNSLMINQNEGIKYDAVHLKTEISKLFNTNNSPCQLPDKVRKKLGGKNWAPPFIARYFNSAPDSGTLIEGASVSYILHSLKIQQSNGETRPWILAGSPTYRNFSFENFILDFNSFAFTLDCSGFLNTAINASGILPAVADFATSAESALTTQNSMFVGAGVLVSPIAAAYYGDQVGVTMDTTLRLQILKIVERIPNIQSTDLLIFSNSYEVIWTSNSGSSSFNGEGNFRGTAGGTVGIGSISGNINAGGKITRESNFSQFNTIFTKRKFIPDLVPITLTQVKAKIAELS